MSYGMDSGWKRELIEMLKLEGDEAALDIACGTGDIAFAIARRLNSAASQGWTSQQGCSTSPSANGEKGGSQTSAFIAETSCVCLSLMKLSIA